MATTRSALTEEDIRTLVKGETADVRAVAADKLCRSIERSPLTPEERVLAGDILRIMAADAAELVRRALAVTLKESPLVPRDVALKLARDVESVALPMLNFSPVFTDEDLIEIVRLGGPARQHAVAKRPKLSRSVTDAFADVGVEKALVAACANDNADFGERALQRILERFEASQAVLSAVAYREILPLSVSERLVSMVGEQVREHLIAHHSLSAETAMGMAVGAAERATLDLVDQAGRTADVKRFVVHLNQEKRLTASLLLRALAQGHMTFFEWGVSRVVRRAAPSHLVDDPRRGPAGPSRYLRAGRAARTAVPRFPRGGRHLPFDGVRRRDARSRAVPGAHAATVPDPAGGGGQGRRRLPDRQDGQAGPQAPAHPRLRRARLRTDQVTTDW
jgi:uncharacterized protein (DUF2336 family)